MDFLYLDRDILYCLEYSLKAVESELGSFLSVLSNDVSTSLPEVGGTWGPNIPHCILSTFMNVFCLIPFYC